MIGSLVREYRDHLISSRKGISDVVISILPQGVSLLANLVAAILVARGLGPKELGDYTLVLSVSAMILSLSEMGIGQTAIRYAARCLSNNDEEGFHAVLRWAFRIRMLLVLGVSIMVFALTPFIAGELWHNDALAFWIRASLLIGVFGAAGSIVTVYLQSLKRFRSNAGILILQAGVLLAGIGVLAVFHRWSVGGVILVGIGAQAVNALIPVFMMPWKALVSWSDFRLIRERPEFLLKAPKFANYSVTNSDDSTATVFAFYMMLSAAIVMLVVKSDVWLMGYFLNPRDIGVYNVASRSALPLMMFVTAMNMVLWPRTANLKQEKDVAKFVRGIFMLSGLAATFALAYTMVAPLFIPWLFGDAYEESIWLGQLLCLRFCFTIVLSPVGIIGYNFGFVRFIWLINLIQLAAVITINVLLLPVYGAVASAIALIVVELIGGVFTVPVLWRRIQQLDKGAR